MADAEALTRIRGAHKASGTKMLGQAETLLGADSIDVDGLVVLHGSIVSKLKTINTLDSEVTPEDQLDAEVTEADEYTSKYNSELTEY